MAVTEVRDARCSTSMGILYLTPLFWTLMICMLLYSIEASPSTTILLPLHLRLAKASHFSNRSLRFDHWSLVEPTG
ncbi:hypothetical protein BDV19DRAFT_245194 [Aspergillus venezuelensis]